MINENPTEGELTEIEETLLEKVEENLLEKVEEILPEAKNCRQCGFPLEDDEFEKICSMCQDAKRSSW